MAELFIELFSEEIPAKLQIDARQKIKQMIDEKLQKKEINFKKNEIKKYKFKYSLSISNSHDESL